MTEENKTEKTEDQVAALAEQMGWKPQEEWQGSDDEWVDASTFILNADMIQKHQSGDMKKLKSTIDSLNSKIEELSINQAKTIKQSIESARDRWEKEMDKAIEEGDVEKAKQAGDKIKELNKAPDEPPPSAQLSDRIAVEAKGRDWYADPFLRREAIIAGNAIAAEGDDGKPWTDPIKYVDEVEQYLSMKYPDKVALGKAKPSHKPTLVSPPKPAKKTGTVWEKMVAEIPELENAFDQLVAQNIGYKDDKESREKYANAVMEQQQRNVI